jgi:hypothetical protein
MEFHLEDGQGYLSAIFLLSKSIYSAVRSATLISKLLDGDVRSEINS